MRHLLTPHDFPFGTQYYRAPSPQPSEWERDLRTIARLGMNTVKFWVQWRWNNPAEGECDFEDIDRLMAIAQKAGLRVMLNTIFDVAPAWMYRKYPDAVMITLDGRRAGPQTQPHRQIGGLGICFNHQEAMAEAFDFLRTVVKRYTGHPALAMWNVASEPELTQSMAELRLYADDAGKMGDMLCYCANCQLQFKRWLGTKYSTIGALNTAWNRRYGSFDEVEIPRTRNTFNDMVDWRMFFVHTLGENVRQRFEIAGAEDRGRHPLLCHHVFIQGFPVTSTASDPWNVGQYGDLHGFTQMDDPMMADVLRSCARGKPVISAEMLMLFGYTLDLPKLLDPNTIKRYVFTGVAANLKGFINWQYRPETLGREAPTWGLTHPDGSATPWLKAFAEVGKVLQKNAAFLLDARPPEAQIAMLYNPENQIFGWTATGSEKNVTDSLLGTHKALYEHNFTVDFVHPNDFESNILRKYKVVYVPFPYWIGGKICGALERWVKGGGVLIAESYFGGWNVESGRHNTTVPGYGMERVFKVRQRVVAPAGADGTVRIRMKTDLPFLPKGSEVFGSMVRETFVLEGASALATFDSGEPAITMARYGKGKAILIGSYVGLPYYRRHVQSNAGLIAGLVQHAADIVRPGVMHGSKFRVDYLTGTEKRMMVIVRNLGEETIEETVILPVKNVSVLTEQFTGRKVKAVRHEAGSKFELRLAAQEVQVFRT